MAPDLCAVLWFLIFGYSAMATGVGASLLARAWFRRHGRPLSLNSATWCVFLPLLSVLAVPLMVGISDGLFSKPEYFGAIPPTRHAWEPLIQRSPAIHALLHITNVLLLLFATFRLAITLRGVQKVCGALRALPRLTVQNQTIRNFSTAGAGDDIVSPPVFLVTTGQPFCFTAGIIRPVIYLSTGLSENLSARHHAAMLAHEAAHIRRRDGLISFLLNLCYSLLPLPGARILLAEWQQAAERACDAEAAYRLKDSLGVAAALVAVARVIQVPLSPTIPSAMAFVPESKDTLDCRVAALLTFAQRNGSTTQFIRETLADRLFRSAFLGVILVADFYLPHAVEFFIHH